MGSANKRFYNWKAKYGGLEVFEAKRLKGLESENAKLKKLLADAMLDNAALKDLWQKNGDARSPAFCVRSERAAARRVTGCIRMTVRYRSRRPDDAELRVRLRALAHARRRFGYRRLLIFLRREGFMVNHKRLFRLYREERLMVRRRSGRKRALGTRAHA
jgi:putative transposase